MRVPSGDQRGEDSERSSLVNFLWLDPSVPTSHNRPSRRSRMMLIEYRTYATMVASGEIWTSDAYSISKMSSLTSGDCWACSVIAPKIVAVKKRALDAPSSINFFTEASLSLLGVEGMSSILCKGGNQYHLPAVNADYSPAP